MPIQIVKTYEIVGFDVPRFARTTEGGEDSGKANSRIKISELTEAQVKELLEDFSHQVLMQVDSYAAKHAAKDNSAKGEKNGKAKQPVAA